MNGSGFLEVADETYIQYIKIRLGKRSFQALFWMFLS